MRTLFIYNWLIAPFFRKEKSRKTLHTFCYKAIDTLISASMIMLQLRQWNDTESFRVDRYVKVNECSIGISKKKTIHLDAFIETSGKRMQQADSSIRQWIKHKRLADSWTPIVMFTEIVRFFWQLEECRHRWTVKRKRIIMNTHRAHSVILWWL